MIDGTMPNPPGQLSDLADRLQTFAKGLEGSMDEVVESGANIAVNKGVSKEITTMTALDIPTVQIGKFADFFNSLTIEELDYLWQDKSIRRKIERPLRYPRGMYEWHLVLRTPQFKYWGIDFKTITDLRTAISEVKFTNLSGIHGGLRSTKAHNELLGIIDSSIDYSMFKRRLNNWAHYRLENGILGLPKDLRMIGGVK